MLLADFYYSIGVLCTTVLADFCYGIGRLLLEYGMFLLHYWQTVNTVLVDFYFSIRRYSCVDGLPLPISILDSRAA